MSAWLQRSVFLIGFFQSFREETDVLVSCDCYEVAAGYIDPKLKKIQMRKLQRESSSQHC